MTKMSNKGIIVQTYWTEARDSCPSEVSPEVSAIAHAHTQKHNNSVLELNCLHNQIHRHMVIPTYA